MLIERTKPTFYESITIDCNESALIELNQHLRNRLERIDNNGRTRSLAALTQHEHGGIADARRTYLNLSGNDYLGIAANRALVNQFYRQIGPDTLLREFGPGAAGSRLMTGNSPIYDRLEKRLAELYNKERCLVFNSGFHGNSGILPALAGKGDLILADKLCHASLIDGMRLSRAETIRYRHLDYDHLENILRTRRSACRQAFIVSESIFSMDGDRADLHALIALKKKYHCNLYLDEAHAVGVLGNRGLGLAEQQDAVEGVDLLFGTFGKALGGQGGFVVCSKTVADYLVNTARSLIFTTALPPVCLSWISFVLERIPAMRDDRERLQRLAEELRRQLARQGLTTGGSSHIVPVMIGDSDRAVHLAQALRNRGYWVTAVRPPTVPIGTARLRLSVTAAMNRDDLGPLPALITAALNNPALIGSK